MSCVELKRLDLSAEADKVFKKLGRAEHHMGFLGQTRIELLDKQIMTHEEMEKAFPALDQALAELLSKGLVELFQASKGQCYSLTDKGSRLAC